MIKRNLEKEVLLTNDENNLLINSPIKLEYYLLESEIKEIDELKGQTAYGIEIVKKVNGENEEAKSFRNILCCEDSIRNLLNKLALNTVTPISLAYVLDDMIGT